MTKHKLTLSEQYGTKLNELSKIMKPVPLARALDCSTRTVSNWLVNPGSIKLEWAQMIDEVHNRVVVK